jgi:sugar lactone lactonase YvrE
MRYVVRFVLVFPIVLVGEGCHRIGGLTPDSAGVVAVANVGFAQPENLVYDATADAYYVSNMGAGNPAAHDHNGFISKVAPDGRIVALRWIASGVNGAVLDAPKGLALRGDTLAVADVGGVHLFDRRTGAPLKTISLPGLVMNDLAWGSDGSLWVTDTGPDRTTTPPDTSKDMDAVWRVTPDGRVRAVTRGLFLSRPDGIALDGATAVVATFGANKLERVGASANSISTVATLPGGRVDGLRELADGSLVTTSWDAKTVWHLDGEHHAAPLLRNVTSPAGVAIDTRRGRVAITSMEGNAMYLLPLR